MVLTILRLPFAHPNALTRLSPERLLTDLLRIFEHLESQDTVTDKSDEQDSSSSESSDDSGHSPGRNNTLWASNHLTSPERETSTVPEMGGSIFVSSSESALTASTTNQEHSDVLVPAQALIT